MVAGRELNVGASIGSTRFPQDAATVAALVHEADAATYRRKQQRKAAREGPAPVTL